MSKVIIRSPKRRIERVRAQLSFTYSNSATDLVLHAAEDSKTLVRMKGSFVVYQSASEASAAASRAFVNLFRINPNSVVTVTPATGQAPDVDVIMDELFQLSGGMLTWYSTPIGGNQIKYDFDTKLMRKMKAGDEVALGYIASQGGVLGAVGDVYMWFKE